MTTELKWEGPRSRTPNSRVFRQGREVAASGPRGQKDVRISTVREIKKKTKQKNAPLSPARRTVAALASSHTSVLIINKPLHRSHSSSRCTRGTAPFWDRWGASGPEDLRRGGGYGQGWNGSIKRRVSHSDAHNEAGAAVVVACVALSSRELLPDSWSQMEWREGLKSKGKKHPWWLSAKFVTVFLGYRSQVTFLLLFPHPRKRQTMK